MNIIFFNAFHNGDIHVSRSFVKYITENIDAKFYYAHKNKKLLQDIPKIQEDNNLMSRIGNRYNLEYFEDGDNLYLNTWYAAGNHKYMNIYGITFDTLYTLFENHFNKLNLRIPGPTDMFPYIDYSYYKISGIKEYMDSRINKIFISNGTSLSGQSDNFNMGNAINNLAAKNKDKHFFITNEDSIIKGDNICYTKNLINKNDCDLNENAYISAFCDMVIGRASGAFSFCLNKENLFEKDILFLPISNLAGKYDYWIGDKLKDIKYKSSVLNYDIKSEAEFENIIDKHMGEYKWQTL